MARILLADDDAATRDFVRHALVADGHDVSVTQDGVEALEQLAQSQPIQFDVLCTDVQMPGVDGLVLAERALQMGPEIRVLLMSGFADALERAARLSPGRVSVLAKPFTLDQVRAAVRALAS